MRARIGRAREEGLRDRDRPVRWPPMATLRMFASAREAAGTGRAEFAGTTVGDVLAAAISTFGDGFARVLPSCKVWVNGEAADPSDPVSAGDEVAVLPPVSGGC